MKRYTVGDVMTTAVVSVDESTTYHAVVDVLMSRGISAVPVTDPDGRVVGVVSEADLLHKVELAGTSPVRRLVERKRTRSGRARATAATAGQLMTEPAVTVRPSTTVQAAAALMAQEHVKRLPVVDGSGYPVGIVSRRDLLRQYTRPDDEILSEIREQVFVRTLWMEPDSVEVGVAAGVVTLAGAVDRRSTVSILETLVGAVPGVVAVTNHLSYHFDDRADRVPATPVA